MNPQKKEEPKKAYACAQSSKTMNINQFAEHIATHGCVYSRADIAAILTMVVDWMRAVFPLTPVLRNRKPDWKNCCGNSTKFFPKP
ncbi:hypothetical protein HMPREF1077_02657 [Parabacteroides johnsonii CL02T12C29]|uniref:HU domain-containing protein n=1 Tax=Parabacteroides johnsonii CL02T12C29 TaxID=999419 RepID=K5Z8S6_9BACT|nr:hypothetical protein HMPREF1077_02657 [Parabacteroides johnsonii CL02T12C29]